MTEVRVGGVVNAKYALELCSVFCVEIDLLPISRGLPRWIACAEDKLEGFVMGKYRDRLQIIADILSTVRKGSKKTRIMYQANLSYRLLCRYLRDVVDSGLISFDKGDYYVLTDKGKEFLDRHEKYSKRCKSLEGHREYVDSDKLALERMSSSTSVNSDFDG